jgi:ABC-2 type transport system ATP-binding protein
MNKILEIIRISKAFAKNKVLNDLSLDVYNGDIIGLIGKSGCGKSTLFKILVGYYKADSGKILFNGRDITKDFDAIKRAVGYTTQENVFYEKLTVIENMFYYARLYSVKKPNLRKYLESVLSWVGLLDAKNKMACDISGGMKRRLDFAISIIHDPQILILDEPTAGLDPLLIDQFWNVVYNVAKRGNKAILIASHMVNEVEKHCSKAAIMDKGRIVSLIKLTGTKINLEDKFRKIVS